MKSIKIFALALGTIALLPTVSLANSVGSTNQEVNIRSTTVGRGNVVVSDVNQSSIHVQRSSDPDDNLTGTNQRVDVDTTTIGIGNIDIKKIIQSAINDQLSN
jgi:hypothetical protein